MRSWPSPCLLVQVARFARRFTPNDSVNKPWSTVVYPLAPPDYAALCCFVRWEFNVRSVFSLLVECKLSLRANAYDFLHGTASNKQRSDPFRDCWNDRPTDRPIDPAADRVVHRDLTPTSLQRSIKNPAARVPTCYVNSKDICFDCFFVG